MDFQAEKIGDVMHVLLMTDTMDANNSKEFKAAMAPIIAENTKVVLGMNQINFVDSSGCGALLSCLRQLSNAGGDLKVYGLRKRVRTLFELVRLHRIIDIFNTKEEAVSSF